MRLTLKQWRKLRELSRKELADAVGVHEQTIFNIERDATKTQLFTIVKILEVLNVGFDEVIFMPCDLTNCKVDVK